MRAPCTVPCSQERLLTTLRGPLALYSPGRPELYKLHQPTPQPRLNIGKDSKTSLRSLYLSGTEHCVRVRNTNTVFELCSEHRYSAEHRSVFRKPSGPGMAQTNHLHIYILDAIGRYAPRAARGLLQGASPTACTGGAVVVGRMGASRPEKLTMVNRRHKSAGPVTAGPN